MLFRFSLYGFLKNLRPFEAFLVLALLERGLDFLAIGALVSVRTLAIHLLEVPTGALADAYGRRRCMLASMLAYLGAYGVLGLATSWSVLALGMLAFGVGDAFRSGTHKALIYAWLRQEGRVAERTRVYGTTRAWSKVGSACSALLGGALVVAGADYRWLFLAAVPPAGLNLLNLASYPARLDPPARAWGGIVRETLTHLRAGARAALGRGRVRQLVLASVAVQGGYEVAKDYVQPALQTLALSVPLGLGLAGEQRTGVLVGVVSAVLFLLAGWASRRAHALESALGGADRSARAIAAAVVGGYALIGACAWLGQTWLAVLVFVGLSIAQNLWRPIQVGRFDRDGAEAQGATVLSIESQGEALAAALLAPLVGALVDLGARGAEPVPVRALWPVALLGLPILALLLARGMHPPRAEDSPAVGEPPQPLPARSAEGS